MSTLTSAASSSSSATLTLTDWWLIDPTDNTYNTIIYLRAGTFDYEENEGQTVVYPLGSTRPKVVRSQLLGISGTLGIICSTDTQFNNVKSLRDTQRTLLLRSDMDEQWHIAITGKIGVHLMQSTNRLTTPHRRVDIPFVEVAAPA